MALKLLIVDDDRNIIRGYQKGISEWNEERGELPEIVPEIARNPHEARDALKENYFDAAIIDIRLDETDKSKAEGNDVLDIIYEKIRFPTYVLSSNINDLDEKYDSNHFISKHARDTVLFTDVLDLIVKRFSTGITNILGQRGSFEKALNRVFWHHLPQAITHWEASDLDSGTKEKQLLRYTLSHLQEMLSTGDDGVDDRRNRAEIYIYPPVNEGPLAGLVVKKDNDNYAMVITPSCDLAQGKADHVQLVNIINLLEREDILGKTAVTKRKQLIESYVCNNKGDRYHFLPHFGELKPGVLDFQRVSNIEIVELNNQYQRICSISPSFYKDIVSRFSAYYARQGSPDFDFKTISNEIDEMLPALGA